MLAISILPLKSKENYLFEKNKKIQTSGNWGYPTKSPLSVVFTQWLTNRSGGR
jgi:hypothetical protein